MTARQILNAAEDEIDRAERLLEIAHIAKRLSVCHETVYRLIWAKKLPAIKVGGGWRIMQADLDAYLTSRRSTPFNKPPHTSP
jgi:excisionase family DNA binding protein